MRFGSCICKSKSPDENAENAENAENSRSYQYPETKIITRNSGMPITTRNADDNVLDVLPIGIIITDHQIKLEYMNIQAIKMLKEEHDIDTILRHYTLYDVLSTKIVSHIEEFIKTAGVSINFFSYIICKKNGKLWFEFNVMKRKESIHIYLTNITNIMNYKKLLKKKSNENKHLLYDIIYKAFPDFVIQRLLKKDVEFLFSHTDAIICYFDVVDYTSHCKHNINMFTVLRDMYYETDKLCLKHNVYRIEIIGDALIVAGNLFEHKKNNVEDCINFMLDCIEYVKDTSIQIRCGIAIGNCRSGMIGENQIRYHIFGDVVNIAARLQSKSDVNSVHISSAVYKKIKDKSMYDLLDKGNSDYKGLDAIHTWMITK